ncbi:MAG TPA: DNA repair protein RecO [Patescibacteria group bacterium]|nr:DNA repair protein RecO [Patescibacteria group bacterium]
MKPRSYSSEGIVLARRNFGEADRILVIFTKNTGRLSLIAKGVRRPKSRKRGHIEVFNQVAFQASSGKGIDIMTEAEVIDDFSEIRKSLKKVSLAYYLAEVVGRITHDNEANSELYDLILETYEKLKTAKRLRILRLNFISDLLTLTGFWPKGRPIPDPDTKLEEVIERQIASERVGKRMIQ